MAAPKRCLLSIALWFGVLITAGGSALSCAEEGPYPRKPIRMVVGFPPGGQSDTVARVIAERLTGSLGQPVVIENVTGAAGNIAAERVARASRDGYTLGMLASPQLVINPSLYKLTFDPLTDFAPVSLVVETPTLLVVHNAVPANTLQELVRLARRSPGELTFASSGPGTEGHLTGVLLRSVASIDIRHIPYKGVVAAIPDLLGGRVTMMFSPASVVLPLARDGKLRPLAVTSRTRTPAAPELPTIAESGYPGFDVTGWNALVAPAGTPSPIIRKLYLETVEALAPPAVRAKLINLGLEPVGNTPQELTGVIRAQIPRWAKLVKDSGIKLE